MSKYNAADFALKRAQAQRNVESHIATLLFSAAKKIVTMSASYRTNKTLARKKEFDRKAQKLVQEVQEDTEAYIRAYAKASLKILGLPNDVIDEYLDGKVFGKTFVERNRNYIKTFAGDIVRMVKAGVLMGYTQSQILSAVRTGYKNPFRSTIVTKAQRKHLDVDTPSYGRGIYRSSYENIMRNARNTVALAWAKALEEYAEEEGYGYFRVHRGSSYPCDTCDHETTYIHNLGKDPMPPYHANCVCYIEFVTKEGD